MKDNEKWVVSHPYKMALIASSVCSILAIVICWRIDNWSSFVMWLPVIFIWDLLFAVLSEISERK